MSTTAEILDKLQGLDSPTLLALIDKFPDGREGLDAVLAGKKTIILEEVIKLLVDRNGRCIPDPEKVTAAVCDADYNHRFFALPVCHNFSSTLDIWFERFEQNIDIDTNGFLEAINVIKRRIRKDRSIPWLLNNGAKPCFPLILPAIPKQADDGKKGEERQPDYGWFIEKILLKAVKDSYNGKHNAAFSNRDFINPNIGNLAGNVTIVEERHAKLYADLADGPIVGILFPQAMQGFCVYAQRQMVQLMPKEFSLAGPLEFAVAETLYPNHLSSDNRSLVKDCSAAKFNDPANPNPNLDCSLCFYAGEDSLGFGKSLLLNRARNHHSGGLFLCY